MVLNEPDFPADREGIEHEDVKERDDQKGCQEEPEIRRIEVARSQAEYVPIMTKSKFLVWKSCTITIKTKARII